MSLARLARPEPRRAPEPRAPERSWLEREERSGEAARRRPGIAGRSGSMQLVSALGVAPSSVQRLYLLCGPAFSGKSTLAALAARGALLVSLDAILRQQGLEPGAGLPPQRWEEASSRRFSQAFGPWRALRRTDGRERYGSCGLRTSRGAAPTR